MWLWIAAGAGVLILGILALVALRPTTVTVTPRSHTTVLTNATSFTAYPAETAATGTLVYTVRSLDLEDSTVVAASGTTSSAPSKASGSIVVYNDYSTSPVTLVKNTRFETPDGLVFRVPAQVAVPGKKGTTPGEIKITVVADQTGEKYNVGPTAKFTLPGLKSTPAMYSGVYAKSSAAMSGGSSGVSGPAVESATEAAAIASLNASLRSKALESIRDAGDGMLALTDLMDIAYTRSPNTAEAGSQARIHETAHVRVPVIASAELGRAVGIAVSADAANSDITITPGEGFVATLTGPAPDLGSAPLQFTLTGQATLVWNIDTQALTQALAGRDEGAFQTVIEGFTGIQEAHARIQPFWKSTFPTDPSKIQVTLLPPKEGQ